MVNIAIYLLISGLKISISKLKILISGLKISISGLKKSISSLKGPKGPKRAGLTQFVLGRLFLAPGSLDPEAKEPRGQSLTICNAIFSNF